MSDEPVSLGERLDVVAFVCAAATTIVLATNAIFALSMRTVVGAAPSPFHQRVQQLADPANVVLGLVVLSGSAALAVRRWLNGDRTGPPDAFGQLVVLTAGAVAVLALVGMIADALAFEGAVWYWRLRSIGEHLAAAALAGAGCWLARPR